MIDDALPWPEIGLVSERVAGSHIFQGLCEKTYLLRADGRREYALVCDAVALDFSVELTGLLSEHDASRSPFQPGRALSSLRQALDEEQGAALLQFLRYSPWLLAFVKVKEASLGPVLHGIMLARLLDLLIMLMERENLTGGRLRDSHRLLLRARFLVLARLSQQEHRDETIRYLADLDLQVREAWQAWGQTLLQSPEEMSILLERYDRKAEDEGQLLLFQPAGNALWPFVSGKEDCLFAEHLLTRWFLPRYDLAHTLQVLSLFPEPTATEPSSSAPWSIVCHLRRGIGSILRRVVPALQVPFSAAAVLLLGIPLVLPRCIWLRGPVGQVGWWGAVVLALVTIFQVLVLGTQMLRYTLPRITLAILVGYLALVSSNEIMQFAVLAYEEHVVLAWAAALAGIGTSFLAVYIEARRRLETFALAGKRAGRVLLIAASRSLTLGWLILAPAGTLLLEGTPAANMARHSATWIGELRVHPQLISVLTPLALFIGIFVQTVWEEHPLTHPL